jgi:hypothetical protein
MLPGCVTSVQKPSGRLTGPKLEKVEDPKEESGQTGKRSARTELRKSARRRLWGPSGGAHHITVMGPNAERLRTKPIATSDTRCKHGPAVRSVRWDEVHFQIQDEKEDGEG